jgi:pentatricopeptide repeat protein
VAGEGAPQYDQATEQPQQGDAGFAGPTITKFVVGPYGHEKMVQELRKPKPDLNQVWSRFLSVSPQISAWDYNLLGPLLNSIRVAFCNGQPTPVLPTEVLLRYLQLRPVRQIPEGKRVEFFNLEFRKTIFVLTNELLLRLSKTAASESEIEPILAELVSVWQLLFQSRGFKNSEVGALDREWHSLPTASDLESSPWDPTAPRNVVRRLQSYLSTATGNEQLAFSAVTIFDLLSHRSIYGINVSETLRAEAAPFIRFMAHILAGSNVKSLELYLQQYNMAFKTLPEAFQKTVLGSLSAAIVTARSLIGAKATGEKPLSEAQQALNQEEHLLKRIARAVGEHSHKGRLERLWDEAIKAYTTKDNKTTIPLAVYNAFLTGFLALFAGDKSIQVWNHMIANGVKPDVKTWTAMLSGCEKARDLNGLNAMWTRMIRSGIQPDIYAWTCRVHGLVSLRQINEGFAAMDEMGRQWLASQQADSHVPKKGTKNSAIDPDNKPPKPSVEIVNGAASAIAQIPRRSLSFERKAEYVRQILQWAGSFAIKPDARTYNILLQLYISEQDNATVLQLLKKMEMDGIEPDMATYTMLIRAAFDNDQFSGLSPSEQSARVTALFSELEAGGLKLNSYIYSSTIDRLLKQYGNFQAVRAAVDHMLSRNLTPTPHIYTSLITHYFQQSPPDINAVDSLWLTVMKIPGTPTDKVLFDRIIEGYAAVDEVGKMMAVLTTMSKHGKLPGWPALTAVVSALARAGDWERARSVVKDVQNGEGVAQGGISGGMHGAKAFETTVRNLRIMDPEAEISQSGWDAGAQGVPAEEPLDMGMERVYESNVQPEEGLDARDLRGDENGSVGGIPL